MFTFPPGAGVFALAGLVAAAGPVIIHLLNRRRFRVVQWGAMQFLLEAVQRNRRILHLRDLLLLLLRTAAILLFGLALARPMFSSSNSASDSSQPVHAVLVVDNSLSMGYQRLNHTLLDEAKGTAKEFLESLPEGSRISVRPLCGSAAGVALDAYRTKEDARDALDRIEVVDRTGSALQALDAALDARSRVPDFAAATRVVFLGDQQSINWPAGAWGNLPKDLPELQVVAIAPQEIENTWVERFAVQDGIADVETSAVLAAVVRHVGPPRSNVQVTLTVDGNEVASQTIDLEPGQSREVTFHYRFDVAAEPGKPVYVPARISLPPDHLPEDDERWLAVPVVAALPVVFVDQYGSEEDPKRNRYGETRHLRRLLAPVTSREEVQRQLVQIRHVKIDQLERSLLEDARLVVIAGVASPEGSLPLLESFVRQGGQLVIVAGGEFDPAAWNQLAWADGKGVLPAPLKPQLVGKTPEEATGELRPSQLEFNSLSHDYFQLDDVPREELEDLYSLPLFFKTVEVDIGDDMAGKLVELEREQLSTRRDFLVQAREKLRRWAELEVKGKLTPADRQERSHLEQERDTVEPRWLLWPEQASAPESNEDLQTAAERTRPQILAALDNRLPLLVRRDLGRGEVMFFASSLFSSWNTLPKTNAMLLMDRVLRGMLEHTLPPRNIGSVEQFVIPVSDRNAQYTLTRPMGPPEPLPVDALGADNYGVTIRSALERGIYKITASRPDDSVISASTSSTTALSAAADSQRLPAKLWEAVVAVNGPGRESEPAVLDEAGLRERLAGALPFRWVARGEAISVAGAQVSGQNLWKWLLALVLLGLLAESAILARPMLGRGGSA